jgi:hypothetical protein
MEKQSKETKKSDLFLLWWPSIGIILFFICRYFEYNLNSLVLVFLAFACIMLAFNVRPRDSKDKFNSTLFQRLTYIIYMELFVVSFVVLLMNFILVFLRLA